MLTIQGAKLLQDIEIEIDHFTVLAGFNATGKSMIARTVYAIAAKDLEELERLWRHQPKEGESLRVSLILPGEDDGGLRLSYSTPLPRYEPNNYDPRRQHILAELLPEYRVLLRQALLDSRRLYKAIGHGEYFLKNICEIIESLPEEYYIADANKCREIAENLLNELEYLGDNVLFLLVNTHTKYKAQFRERDYDYIRNLYSIIVERAVKTLNELAEPAGEEIKREDLFPLDITVIKDHVGERYSVEICDKRIGEAGRCTAVPLDAVSSSVAASFTLSTMLYILSQPYRRIVLVVEEPEETLSPPQQFVIGYLMGFLAREVSQSLGKDVRIVATTHSPYIVLGGLQAGARVYYTMFDWRQRKFTIKQRPLAIFALADRLTLGFRRTVGENKREQAGGS